MPAKKSPAPKKPTAKPAAMKASARSSTGAKKAPEPKAGTAAAKTEASKPQAIPEKVVQLKSMDAAILKDADGSFKASGKWPLIIDTTGTASTFLRYRDCNYVDALSQQEMDPDRLRMAVLGALRYGKPMVIDMMESDLVEACKVALDNVQAGLFEAILDKSVMKEEVYSKLIRDSDGDDYSIYNFSMAENFLFAFLTSKETAPESLEGKIHPVRVVKE